MDWSRVVEWGFEAILAGCAVYGAQSLKAMRDSVDYLNKQMATIIERDVWHTKWLEKHDEDIRDIRGSLK